MFGSCVQQNQTEDIKEDKNVFSYFTLQALCNASIDEWSFNVTGWLRELSCLLSLSVLQEYCSSCELTVYMVGIHFLLKKHTLPANKCTVSIMDSEPQISASITPPIWKTKRMFQLCEHALVVSGLQVYMVPSIIRQCTIGNLMHSFKCMLHIYLNILCDNSGGTSVLFP